MRTLVVSDLHLGARRGRARLHEPAARDRLAGAARTVDRLVLLGDVLELRELPLRDVLVAALPALAAIGEALGSDHEVVIVPGNHDHHLLAAWSARRAATGSAAPLGLESELDWREGEPLAQVAEAIGAGGARVRACYPGIWLREDVYATHGHYLDRHTTVPLLERLAAGANARLLGQGLDDIDRAEDYEASLAPSYAWLHAVAQSGLPRSAADGGRREGPSLRLWHALGRGNGGGGVRRRAAVAAAATGVALLNRAGLGPVRGDLSGAALRRASLRAFGEVLGALSVQSAYAIFGHSHRAGPLPGDDPSEWRAPTGALVLNSGCWVTERSFLGPRESESPYRAGFAIRIDGDGPPALVDLLTPVTPVIAEAIPER